ncbi:MAG: hypothetical protein QOE70_6011 [Chthoniobacter sp.]|jgi:hypothetical protein|nr:hypothetical protein [Chthoniobacter sp.]
MIPQTRRAFLLRAAAFAGGALTGWARPMESDAALRAAGAFLSARQSPDGAWRSTHYGAFREGDALTPLVLRALTATTTADADSVARGMRWLEQLTAAQARRGEPWAELRYPLFTASYVAQVFAGAGDRPRAEFWADLVERLRITAALGWPTHDPACGAWSDASVPPRLPRGDSPPPDMLAPNLSATLLGVQALHAAGRSARATAARPFIERCQNFAASPGDGFDDGGFFFAIADPVRNKAGLAGRDPLGRDRFRSYGSATCDGLLALHACGAASDAPPIRAAFQWLRREASGARHGGDWPADRQDEQESLRYYHAQAFAAALSLASVSPELGDWAAGQRRALTADLLTAQHSDGAWSGACPDSFEDDPLVATAFAVRALSNR